MKLTVPIYTEMELSADQMRQVTLAYLESKCYDPKMEFIECVNGTATWVYDASDPRDAHNKWCTFRAATEKEQLYYNTRKSLLDEKFQRN